MNRGEEHKGGRNRSGPHTPHTPVPDDGLVQGPKEVERLVQIASLHLAADNAVAALECLERAESHLSDPVALPAVAVDLKLRKADCFMKRGDLAAALMEVEAALELAPVDEEPILRGMALVREGSIRVSLGDYDAALEACQAAEGLLKPTAEHQLLGRLGLLLGTIHMRRGSVRASQECFESALFSYRRIDHPYGIASALNNLGILLKNGSRWADAQDYLVRAIAVSEEAGHYGLLASLNANLGILYTKLCEWEAARRHLSRAVTIHKEVGNTLSLVRARLALGHLHRRQGQVELAASEYVEARRLAEEHAYGREIVLCFEADADLLVTAGRFSAARDLLHQGVDLAQGVAPDGDLLPELERRLAAIAVASGEPVHGRHLALRAARAARAVGDEAEAGAALRVLGEALAAQGRHTSAERVLARAVSTLAETPERFETSLAEAAYACQMARARVQARGGSRKEIRRRTVDLLQRSWSFMVSIERPDRAAECLADLAEIRVLYGDFDGASRDLARGHALAEKASRSDLAKRLEAIRTRLESRSAESAVLSVPEAEIVRDWGRIFTEGGDVESRLSSMLQFAMDRLDSSSAILAAPSADSENLEVIAVVGQHKAQAKSILCSVRPHLDAQGITLASQLDRDPRFAKQAERAMRDVHALAALGLPLPEGQGVAYFDRRGERREPYGRSDLRVVSVLTSLLGLGVVQLRREQEIAQRRLAQEDASQQGPFAEFITVDQRIRRTFADLERVGDSTASILVLGETGTGKGLLARCIHRASRRRAGPLITVNCAAIPETLLESELFGHKQGSFTGATKDKTGLFEAANGGTLFLDEISRTSLAIQAKLLHVLDTREVRPVGANRGREVDVRVICATNTSLKEAIHQGRFLEDLYYRLSDFVVELPPLRKRDGDVPLLLDAFYADACGEMGRRPRGMAQEVRERLLKHPWPGNVRELMQVVRRLVALSEDGEAIGLDLLPTDIRGADHGVSASVAFEQLVGVGAEVRSGRSAQESGVDADGPGEEGSILKNQMARLERRLISESLAACGWNRSRAARQLGISYPNLLAKIKLYGLMPPR